MEPSGKARPQKLFTSKSIAKSIKNQSGRPRGGLGEALGRASGLGRDLEMLWKVLGESLGWHWEPFGSPLAGLWASLGRPWKRFGDFGEPWELFLGKSFQGKACYMIFVRFLSNFRRFSDFFLSQTASKT